MSLTTDPNDPRLGHGVDKEPIQQHKAYLVLSDEERAKGFVRPVRCSYVHVGFAGPKHPLRDLTSEEDARHNPTARKCYGEPYVKFEVYPASESPATGRYWTQSQLANVGKGCGTLTTMARTIAETYAREPTFYGATYCCGCRKHLKVGEDGEFVWADADYRVGA